jgi:rare lipoprotein A
VALAFLLGACTASPYPPSGGVPHGAGRPYQVNGVWYVPRQDPGYAAVGRASWYGARYHGRRTASGQVFDMHAFTAAHPTLPFGTRVRVTNLENGRSVIVVINDRGPFVRGRIIDLSRRAARSLGFVRKGTASVRVEVAG